MTLIHELEKQGNILFRWRSYIPGVILLVCFFQFSSYTYFRDNYQKQILYTFFCFVISLFGLVIRCWTIGYVPQKTSGRNTKKQIAETLNQKGIYSLLRNPLYVGNFFMFLGIVVYFRDITLVTFFFFFFFFYYERIIFAEEAFLKRKFGEIYNSWSSRTPAILPNLKNYQKPDLAFSFRNILKREYPSYFGLVVIFTLFDIMTLHFNTKTENWQNLIHSIHIYFFSSGLIFYILIRLVSKKTQWLDVENR